MVIVYDWYSFRWIFSVPETWSKENFLFLLMSIFLANVWFWDRLNQKSYLNWSKSNQNFIGNWFIVHWDLTIGYHATIHFLPSLYVNSHTEIKGHYGIVFKSVLIQMCHTILKPTCMFTMCCVCGDASYTNMKTKIKNNEIQSRLYTNLLFFTNWLLLQFPSFLAKWHFNFRYHKTNLSFYAGDFQESNL